MPHFFSIHRWPLLVLCAGLCLTLLAGYYSHRQETEWLENELDRAGSNYRAVIEGRIKQLNQEINSLSRLLRDNTNSSEFSFSFYAAGAQKHLPEITHVMWAKTQLDLQTRLLGHCSAQLTYFWPHPEIAQSISGSFVNNDSLHQVFMRSRDTGGSQIVPKGLIEMGPDETCETSATLVQAVYGNKEQLVTVEDRRRHLSGYLILDFDVKAILDNAVSGFAAQGLDLYIVKEGDKPEVIGAHLSRTSAGSPLLSATQLSQYDGLMLKSRLWFSDRDWAFYAVPKQFFFDDHKTYGTQIVVIMGGLLSAAMSALFWVVVRREQSSAYTAYRKSKELEESQTKSDSIVNNVSDGLVVTTLDGEIVELNPAVEKIFGYSKVELLGQNVSLLMPESQRRAHDEYMAHTDLYETRIINRQRELVGQRKDGSKFMLELNVTRMIQGGEAFFIGLMKDVSERVEQQKRTQEYLDNIPVGFLVVNGNGLIEFVNSTFLEMYSAIKNSIYVGASFESFVRAGVEAGLYADVTTDNAEEWIEERLQKHHQSEMNFEYEMVNGKHYNISIRQLQNGTRLGVHTDVSTLRQAVQSADEANKAKSSFLSAMSHELRTPLNSIIGFSNLLLMSKRDPISDRQRLQVESISRGGAHLLDLISEILDLSKIETGNLTLSIEDVNLSVIIEDCLGLVEPIAEKHRIKLELISDVSEGLHLKVDRVRLKQVLMNLLSNAIKYNRPEGNVWLNCHLEETGMLLVSIVDNGIGIPVEKERELFKPFNRLGAEDTKVEGSGIGLALTKNLIEEMGGEIGFSSVPEQSTTFWFRLPTGEGKQSVEKDVENARVNAGHENASMKHIRLLYVEDNQANVDLMESFMDEYDHIELRCVMSSELALSEAIEFKPDLIVTDLHMPKLNGYDVKKQLQSNEATHHIPTIALTADAMLETQEKVLQSGFTRYLTKPIDAEELFKVIEELA